MAQKRLPDHVRPPHEEDATAIEYGYLGMHSSFFDGPGGHLPGHIQPPCASDIDEAALHGYMDRLGLGSHFIRQSDEAEQEHAARDIQAIARGRQARKAKSPVDLEAEPVVVAEVAEPEPEPEPQPQGDNAGYVHPEFGELGGAVISKPDERPQVEISEEAQAFLH